jgi:hypothetical protein
MENDKSLNEEIDLVMKKKLSVCDCNPCTCPGQTKDKYFQELKDILVKSNKEYLRLDLLRINY